MPLDVYFDKKIGEVTLETNVCVTDKKTHKSAMEFREITLGMYDCNAYFTIMFDLDKDKANWTPFILICDKTHLNNCLGLNRLYKGQNRFNVKESCVVKKLRLKKSYKCMFGGDTDYIAQRFLKAFDNITIEMYTD